MGTSLGFGAHGLASRCAMRQSRPQCGLTRLTQRQSLDAAMRQSPSDASLRTVDIPVGIRSGETFSPERNPTREIRIGLRSVQNVSPERIPTENATHALRLRAMR